MIFSFLKKTFIFLLLLSTAFSSVPSFIIEEGVKIAFNNNNVVDRIWLSNRDANVVDQFEPFTKVVERLKVGTALAAAQGDGKIFYSISANTTPRTRDYVASSNSFSAAVATVASSTALQSVIKASPTKDEMIAGYVNATGGLQVMCWNGTSWTNEWTLALGGTGTTRRFDIAYETSTGDAIVLYSRNVATTNELAYRTKPGGSACGSANWAAETNLDATRTTGIVQWVKLASDRRNTASSTTAIWADANADLSVRSWNGSAWGSEPAAVLEATLEGATTAPDVESFDVEYESLSGEAMVVWSTTGAGNGTNGIKYATSTVDGVWGAATALTTTNALRQEGTALDISANPNTNEIVFASIGNGRTALQAAYWSGSAWTTNAAPNGVDMTTATAAPLAGTKFVSTGWLISGATTRSVIVYYDLNATNIGWAVGNGSSFTIQTDASPTTAFGVQKNYDVKMDPINKDRLIFAVNDASSDIFAKRLIMDATPTFTWTDADGGAAIEANTASALYKTFDFEYNRFIPPTTTLGTGTDPGPGVIIAPGAGATDVDQFTLQTSTSTETITSVTVNLSTNSGIGTLAITDSANTVLASTISPVTGSNTITVAGMSAGTTIGTFKVRVTPLSHVAMPVVPGAEYAITAPVTAWGGTLVHAGSDTNTNALTIDNLSPGIATATSGTVGDTQITVNYTTPAGTDLNSIVILRNTVAITGTPTEGATYIAGNAVGADTVGCVDSTVAASTADSCVATGLVNGTAYYFKIFIKDTNGNYSTGVAVGPVTPVVGISITSYANNTDATLNFSACATTGCGARIGPGAFKHNITIMGTGFGVATGTISVGTHSVATANVKSWADTSATFETDSSFDGDTDTSWGTNYGGATALTVATALSATSSGVQFHVFPQVTSITTCDKPGFPVGSGAREYDVTDAACPNGLKDGQVKLVGTRFGTASTTGWVRILGCDSATCASPTGSVVADSWANELIQVQVPPIITDTVNNGSLIVQQGTGSNNKTHTYTSTAFLVFPRITGFTPTSASEGTAVAVNGNHFCQTGTCPGAFSAGVNDVVFTSAVSATTFTTWTATAMTTAVPTGAVTGSVVLKSNSNASNALSFTVLSNTPSQPTSLGQWRNSGLTQAIVTTSPAASTTPIYLSQVMEVPSITGGTLYPQFEIDPVVTAFTCGAGACAQATEGIGWAGPGPVTGTTTVSVADGVYHWQARTRHNKASVDFYSPWVSFGGNAEGATDFQMDTTAPVITDVCSGPPGILCSVSPGTNSVTIKWNTTGEISTTRIEYDTAGTFIGGYDCAGSTECTAIIDTAPLVNSHSVTLSNLNSGTTYSYRVRSKDAAGNEASSTISTFTTSSTLSPAKGTRFHIIGQTGAGLASTTFSVTIPENATTTKNMFVEIRGVYLTGATPNITVQVNAETARTYVMPASFKYGFKILHPVTAINVAPGINTLTVTPAGGNSLYIASADIYVNYTYTP